MNDTVNKLVVFLVKRDDINKLVKTFQYVPKLIHWHIETTHPDAAKHAKQWEVASDLSHKTFQSGRFLTGFNALRQGLDPTPLLHSLAVFVNGNEMVYFFFDHFLWLARIRVMDGDVATGAESDPRGAHAASWARLRDSNGERVTGSGRGWRRRWEWTAATELRRRWAPSVKTGVSVLSDLEEREMWLRRDGDGRWLRG